MVVSTHTHFNVAWRRHVWVDTTISRRFGKSLLFFNQSHFNVAWRRHVWVDTTMSPISSSAHFGSTVYLNMIDDQMISIQTLVFSIRFGVFQQVQQEFGGFLRPTTLGSSMNLSLGMTTNTTHESTKWNNFLLFDNVFQVSGSTMKRHFLDGLSRFSSVLKMDTKVGHYSIGSLCGVVRFCGVTSHIC